MFGLHARVDGEVFHFLFKVFVADFVKFRTRDRLRCVGDDAKLHSDCNGGVFVVARNHDGAYARLFALHDCVFHFGTDGVYHADKPDKAQVGLDKFAFVFFGRGVKVFLCKRKHAQSLVCHFFVLGKDFGAFFVGHRHDFAALKHECATIHDFVGCAFCELNVFFACAMHGCHHLAH